MATTMYPMDNRTAAPTHGAQIWDPHTQFDWVVFPRPKMGGISHDAIRIRTGGHIVVKAVLPTILERGFRYATLMYDVRQRAVGIQFHTEAEVASGRINPAACYRVNQKDGVISAAAFTGANGFGKGNSQILLPYQWIAANLLVVKILPEIMDEYQNAATAGATSGEAF